jgi:chemotaxis protein histidine kinase CheA
MAQDYTVNVKVTGVDQAKTQVDGLSDSMNEAGTAGGAAFGTLDKVLGGIPSKLKAGIAGLRGMVVGMKTLRGAVMATGIGALVIAVTSLVSYFKRTERGAQQLRVVMATLGGFVDKLMDSVISLGEFLVNVFTKPQETIRQLRDDIQTFVIDKINQLVEGLGLLGKAISQAFSGEFSAAAATAAEGLTKVGDSVLALNPVTAVAYQVAGAVAEIAVEATASAKAAGALEKRMNDLIVAERGHLKVRAQTNKIIAENRLLVEDETMSYDDRIAALDKAIAAELSAVDAELKMARERADILREQAALAESDEETKQAVAEAEARVIEVETRSLKARKRIEGERQTLLLQRTNETEAAAAAIIKAEEEVQKALGEAALKREDAQTQEIEKEKAKFDTLREKAGENVELLAELKEAERLALLDIDAKYDALELEAEKKKEDEAKKIRDAAEEQRKKDTEAAEAAMAALKESAISDTFSVLTSLNQSFSKDTEEGQKKAFKRNQALSVAETLVSTYMAAQKAYASQLAIPSPDAPVRAAIAAGVAVASGLAKVAAIKSQQFSGGGSSGGAAGGGGSIGGGTQSVGVDVGSLIPNQQTPTPEPVRAYVVSNEISNRQALDRELQIQTTL